MIDSGCVPNSKYLIQTKIEKLFMHALRKPPCFWCIMSLFTCEHPRQVQKAFQILLYFAAFGSLLLHFSFNINFSFSRSLQIFSSPHSYSHQHKSERKDFLVRSFQRSRTFFEDASIAGSRVEIGSLFQSRDFDGRGPSLTRAMHIGPGLAPFTQKVRFLSYTP